MDTLIKTAAQTAINNPVQTFESQHASLEDAFLKYYSGEESRGIIHVLQHLPKNPSRWPTLHPSFLC